MRPRRSRLSNAVFCALSALVTAAGPACAESGPAGPHQPAVAAEPYKSDRGYRLASGEELPVVTPLPVPAESQRPFAASIEAAARDAGVDPELVHAVIAVESAYRPDALSPKGAVGLMQVLPETAQRYGVDDPRQIERNLHAGTRHLRNLMQSFGDRIDLVLAAYNAGEGAVRKYGNAIPPYPETRNYVPAVLKRYRERRRAEAPPAATQPAGPREYMAGTRLDPRALDRLP